MYFFYNNFDWDEKQQGEPGGVGRDDCGVGGPAEVRQSWRSLTRHRRPRRPRRRGGVARRELLPVVSRWLLRQSVGELVDSWPLVDACHHAGGELVDGRGAAWRRACRRRNRFGSGRRRRLGQGGAAVAGGHLT